VQFSDRLNKEISLVCFAPMVLAKMFYNAVEYLGHWSPMKFFSQRKFSYILNLFQSRFLQITQAEIYHEDLARVIFHFDRESP
jgi:hypothetical protein